MVDAVKGADRSADSTEHIYLAHILAKVLYIKPFVELFSDSDAKHLIGVVNSYHIVPQIAHDLGDTARTAGKVKEYIVIRPAVALNDLVEVLATFPVVDIGGQIVVITCKSTVAADNYSSSDAGSSALVVSSCAGSSGRMGSVPIKFPALSSIAFSWETRVSVPPSTE